MKDTVKLACALGDVAYEIDMLLSLYEQLWEVHKLAPGPMFQNCAIEATAIHARNLIDFYERGRSGPKNQRAEDDDVCAEDYGFACKKLDLEVGIRTKVNKRVAHITYARTIVSEEDRHWPFREFVPPILKRSHEFVRKLVADQHHLHGDQVSKFCDLALRLSRFA